MTRNLFIFCAMPIEAQAVADACDFKPSGQSDWGRQWTAVRHDRTIYLHTTGIGTRMAQAISDADLTAELNGATDVLIAGFAGALTGGLQAGDVVQPGQVYFENTTPLPLLGQGGSLVTTSKPVLTPDEKKSLHEQSSAVAVDMETYFAAEVLAGKNITPAVIRTISDAADETLPPQVQHWLNPDGSPRTTKVMRDAAFKPSLLKTIKRLQQHSTTAARSLGQAVRAHLEHASS